MKRSGLAILWLASAFFPALSLTAQPELPAGFDNFYNLEYDEAIKTFHEAIQREPKDPERYNHLAQALLYREMFRAGALESELVSGNNPFIRRDKIDSSPEMTTQFQSAIDTSMSLANTRIQANANDTRALFALGIAHGLRANYNFLVRKAWMDALKDATAARKLHNKVAQLEPTLVDAKLIQGVHEYVVGSLPWHYKMLGFLAGMRGDRQTGIATLTEVSQNGNLCRYDAQILLAAIYRREKKAAEALPLLNGLVAQFPRNYLLRLETVQMFSDAGDKDRALTALQKVEELKTANAPGYQRLPMEKVFFYRGNLLFWYDELDRANDQLRKATSNAKTLDLHTALMAWMRLGQVNDMRGRRNEAREAYQKAIATAPLSDVAKESKQYMSSPYKRG